MNCCHNILRPHRCAKHFSKYPLILSNYRSSFLKKTVGYHKKDFKVGKVYFVKYLSEKKGGLETS